MTRVVSRSGPDLRLLFPEDARHFRGHPVAFWFLVLYTIVATVRSLIHILTPDGGASSIAGVDIELPGGANLVALFGQWGVEQLLIAAITWVVIWRYRGLVPAMLTIACLDQLARS